MGVARGAAQPVCAGIRCLPGAGRIVELLRDWDARIPLGAPDVWSPALQTAAATCLQAPTPCALFWGPDLLLLYNDPAIPILGAQHPIALGMPGEGCWHELWQDGSRMLRTAFRSGQPAVAMEILLRNGTGADPSYFQLTYSPIPESGAGCAGVLCWMVETSSAVTANRRLAVLRDLSASMAGAATPEQACRLGLQMLDLPFHALYAAGKDGPRLVGGTELADCPWPWREVLRTGRPQLVEPLPARTFGCTAAMVLPAGPAGRNGAPGFLVAGIPPNQHDDQGFQDLLVLAAEQIGAQLVRAQARPENAAPALAGDPFRALADHVPVLICMTGSGQHCTWVNEPWLKFTGGTLQQSLGRGWMDLVHPNDLGFCLEKFEQRFLDRKPFTLHYRMKRHDGQWRWLLNTAAPAWDADGQFSGFISSCIDITDLKDTERQLLLLTEACSTLLASPQSNDVVHTVLDLAQRFIAADAYALWRQTSPATWRVVESIGLSENYGREVRTSTPNAPALPEGLHAYSDVTASPQLASRRTHYESEGIRAMLTAPLTLHGRVAGTLVFYHRTAHHFTDREKRVAGIVADLAAAALGTSDLYERQRALREAAEQSNRRAAFLAETGALLSSSIDYQATLTTVAEMAVPFFADWCAVSLIDDQGHISRVALKHSDARNAGLLDRLQEHFPARFNAALRLVLRTGKSLLVPEISESLLARHVSRREPIALLIKAGLRSMICTPLIARGRRLGVLTFAIAASRRVYTPEDLSYADELARRAAAAVDNTRLFDDFVRERERVRKANRALQSTNEALRRANADLEQFAFSASHDLQEPLRTVAVYSQILEARLSTKLTEEERVFLGYTISGARRMEQLVKDLLSYVQAARGDSGEPALTSADDALARTLGNLHATIEETGAAVVFDPLPDVAVQAIHLQQLFQNLIGNAIKYRGQEPPKIEVSAEPRGSQVLFRVRDNGIGIDPRYSHLIFGVFKRLHTDDSHSGTGIGLAICQRIVDRYGGRIWVESDLGHGATFCFILPAGKAEPA